MLHHPEALLNHSACVQRVRQAEAAQNQLAAEAVAGSAHRPRRGIVAVAALLTVIRRIASARKTGIEMQDTCTLREMS